MLLLGPGQMNPIFHRAAHICSLCSTLLGAAQLRVVKRIQHEHAGNEQARYSGRPNPTFHRARMSYTAH